MGYGDSRKIRILKSEIRKLDKADYKASMYRTNPSVEHYEHRKMLRAYLLYKIKLIKNEVN